MFSVLNELMEKRTSLLKGFGIIIILPPESDFFSNTLAVIDQNVLTSAEFLPVTIKLLPTIMSLLVSFEIDRREEQIFEFSQTLHFMSHK